MPNNQSPTVPENPPTSPLSSVDRDRLFDCYAGMLRIRRVEERLSKLFAEGEIPGFIHSSIGQESVPVAISRHLDAQDKIAITHRGHGQALAKGVDLESFICEMMGKQAGICKGRGGSMHIADAKVGILGANGIVAGGISIATGSALALKLKGDGNIAVAYFGDGALAEGIFHECMNMSALWSLPILFVCENNGWGEFSRTDTQFCGSLAGIAGTFGVAYRAVDGIDVLAVADVAETMIAAIRTTAKPAVLECKVERFHGHFEGDPQKYRNQEDLQNLDAKDPIAHARERLIAAGLKAAELDYINVELEIEIDQAVEAARAAEAPQFADALREVYAERS